MALLAGLLTVNLINTPLLQNWGFSEFNFFGMDRISLRRMLLKPHERPFKLQKWAFKALKTRNSRGWDL